MTVATEVVPEIQGVSAEGDPEPDSAIEEPTQTEEGPEIVTATGSVTVTLILEILPELDFTYMVYVPAVKPVNVESA